MLDYSSRVNNAKLYWQLLKQGSGLCKSNISLSVLEQYFNSVNNPESPFLQQMRIFYNYRGITLLSTLGKLFTRVINNRLSQWAEEYSVYIEAQAGFRSGMGTVDNIFVLHGLISHILNQGKHLYCAFVDFTKA